MLESIAPMWLRTGLFALAFGSLSGAPLLAEDNPDTSTTPLPAESQSTETRATESLPVQQVSPPPAGQIPDVDPFALYGGDIIFDVYRKNSRIGEHRVSFEQSGDRLSVGVQFKLAVNFLFFRAYTFEYQSSEIWQDRALYAVSSHVDDNGKETNVVGREDGGVFKIEGPRGPALASSWVFPTNHWHRGQVNSKTILNTLNGRLAHVEIVSKGIERLQTAQGPVDAERFTYTGDLRDTDVWYDQAGRWVKMAFKAKDGSTIEHRCRQCGLGPPVMDQALETEDPSPGLAEFNAKDVNAP